jgi:GT2 family glycosyltransferase
MDAILPDLSVIVVNWNTKELLQACLESVRVHISGIAYELIVVDNGSTDGSVDMLREQFPEVRLIANTENLGFAAANNQAIRVAKGRAVLLLNSDTELIENSFRILYDFLFSRDEIGAVGGRLIYPSGAPQWSYGFAPSLGRMLWITLSGFLRIQRGRKPGAVIPDPADPARPVEYIVGADLMIKRTVLDQVGLLDDTFFAYFEETDLCTRIRQAGHQIWYTPATSIIHRIGSSFGPESANRLRIYYTSLFQYLQKHSGTYRAAKLYLTAKFWLHTKLSPNHPDHPVRLHAIRNAKPKG